MTNVFLCGKIICMKKLITFRKTIFCFLILSLLAFSLFILTLNFSRNNFVYAQSVEYENLIPKGEIEQKELSQPIDCYLGADTVAIIQNGGNNDQSLYIYSQADGFANPILNPALQNESLKQVKRFSQDELIVSRNGVYVTVSVTDGSIKKTFSDGGTFFDLNSRYLVSSYGTTVTVYEFDPLLDLQKKYTFSGTTETPVAINGNNEIFFTEGSAPNFNIKKHVIGSSALGDQDQLLFTLSKKPTSILANDEYCYVLEESIYRISLADGTVSELPVIENDKFELGNLVAPSSISFNGDNLIVCDSSTQISAVQEFAVVENGLDFTGFAIAKGKTAYNRISQNALSIERFIDYTVVLDENKLTVINTGEGFTPYNKQSFYNFFAEDIADTTGAYQGVMPKTIALSHNAILLGFENTVKLLHLGKTQQDCLLERVEGLPENVTIKDVCQQNGVFYVLTNDGTTSWLYTVNGNVATLKNTYADCVLTSVAVNVNNKVYISDGDYIYLEDLSTPYCSAKINGNSIVDFSTDLASRLFVNDGNAIYTFDEQNQDFLLTPAFTQTSIKHFALNFDSKKVAYITENSEFIRTTVALNNLAIDGLSLPSDYVTQDLNATQKVPGEYQIYSVIEGSNLYAVNAENNSFIFKKLGKNFGDFALICEVPTAINGFSLLALASPSGTVLVDKMHASELSYVADVAPTRVYVTTKVNAYYIPIVTPDSLYSTVVDLVNMQNIRIEAGTFVNPINTITFMDEDFYFISYDLAGETRYCYIPVGFTVEVPYVESAYSTYTLEKVLATKVYADKELKTEMVALNEGTMVKLYKNENGSCLIAFQDQNGDWINGYISSNSIAINPAISIRNFVIIVAVLACVFASSLFLILRKRKK